MCRDMDQLSKIETFLKLERALLLAGFGANITTFSKAWATPPPSPQVSDAHGSQHGAP